MKEKITLKKLLEKYEQGKCSSDEEQMLHRYFESFQDAGDVWGEIGIEKKEAIYGQILSNIGQRTTHQKSNGYIFLKIAASIVLLIGIGLAIYTIQPIVPTEEVTVVSKTVTKTATNGQKLTLKLPDGSMVYLNSGSEISYPDNFSDSARNISLKGEAFFEVVRDEKRSFIVQIERMTTKVLGTSFNINAYPEKENILVTVATGKVKVASHENRNQGISSEEGVVLAPGYQSSFSKKDFSISTGKVDEDQYLAWKKGIIIFDDIPLQEALSYLERWYGKEINTEQVDISKCFVRSTYEKETLKNILESFSFINGIEYETTAANEITITKFNCL